MLDFRAWYKLGPLCVSLAVARQCLIIRRIGPAWASLGQRMPNARPSKKQPLARRISDWPRPPFVAGSSSTWQSRQAAHSQRETRRDEAPEAAPASSRKHARLFAQHKFNTPAAAHGNVRDHCGWPVASGGGREVHTARPKART